MKRNLTVLAVVIVLAAFALYQNLAAKEVVLPEEQAAKLNFLAPSFTLQGMDGNTYTVGGKREKALLINFWASWCGPCQIEAPDLQLKYETYKNQLDIYGVNVTQLDTEEDAAAFIEGHHLTFSMMLDPEGIATSLYRVEGYPTSFLIDKNGVIRDIILGIVSPRELERKIKRVIDFTA